MCYVYLFVQEYLCALGKAVFALGGEVVAATAARDVGLDVGVALKVAVEAIGHLGALGHDTHTVGHISHDAVHK